MENKIKGGGSRTYADSKWEENNSSTDVHVKMTYA